MSSVFLTAEWRDLIMLNYEINASLLRPFVPAGTELDRWQERLFLSLVGFRFLNTKVFGIPFPFHRNFEEVNLRFYVRRQEGQEVRRGVVFIREIVPRWAIATAARAFYNENYVDRPMSHRIDCANGTCLAAEYSWKSRSHWNRLRVAAKGAPLVPDAGSQQQFIAEHYWGYAAQRDGSCVEYRVDHPPWRVWSAHDAAFEGNAEDMYGPAISGELSKKPVSAFLAEGSKVIVYSGRRL
jgi:uncharacterized protein